MNKLTFLYSHRNLYLKVQGVVLFLTFIYLIINDFRGSNLFFIFLCIWNLFTYLHVFYFEVKFSPDFHPFIILALVTAQYIGLNGIGTYFDLAKGKAIYFVVMDISDMLSGGVWFLMLQHYLTFAGYYYIYKKKYHLHDITIIQELEESNIDYYKWAIRSYIILWIIRIAGIFINWAAYSSIINSYADQGQLITLTLLSFKRLANNKSTPGNAFWIITLIEIILVLGSGMKEDILINLIPYAIFILLSYESGIINLNKKLIARIGVLGAFVIFGVFPYVSIFRSISNERNLDWSEISVTEVLNEYGDYIFKTGKYSEMTQEDYNKSSTTYAISRAGSINCNSWLINRTFNNGTDTKFFKYCLIGLVPRILWPEKPPVVVGNMMYELALGHNDWDKRAQDNARNNKKVTSLAPGFVGASYMTFGLFGAIITFIIPGIVIGLLWFYIKDKLCYNLIAIWLFYIIIRIILKDFEAFKDAGLVFYAMSLFYCILIHIFPNKKYKPNIS